MVAGALERFKPDVTAWALQHAPLHLLSYVMFPHQVLVPDLHGQLPKSFSSGGGRQYVVKAM